MGSTTHSHEKLVALAVQKMRQQNMTGIKADHLPGYETPTQVGGYIPDATAMTLHVPVIVEAESHEGLSQSHTVQQWTAFLNQARRQKGCFIAVVNKNDEATAKSLMQSLSPRPEETLVWAF